MSAPEDSLTVKRRDVIFTEMDAVTQQVAEEGLNKLKAGHQVTILINYDIGTLVARVMDAEHLNETQQKQEIQKLAAYWNQDRMGPTTLYDLRNVAVAFEREFIREQSEQRLANGHYLSFAHFKELQKVGSQKRRLALLKQIRKNSWSANELALELQGKREAEVKRSGGRKPTLPKTPTAMLQKLFTSVQQADNYVVAVGEPLDGLFLELGANDVDAQFAENIELAMTRMNEAAEHLKETEKKLKVVQKRTLSMLKAKMPDTGLEKDSDDGEEAKAAGGAGQPAAVKKRKKSAKRATNDAEGNTAAKKKRGRPRRSAEASNAAPAEADDILSNS